MEGIRFMNNFIVSGKDCYVWNIKSNDSLDAGLQTKLKAYMRKLWWEALYQSKKKTFSRDGYQPHPNVAHFI